VVSQMDGARSMHGSGKKSLQNSSRVNVRR